MVAGAHRRHRPPGPRPARGAAWAGFFLLLAAIAVVASKNLWSGFGAGLLGFGSGEAPQGSVVWQASCSPTSVCSLASGGEVLIAEVSPDNGDAGPSVTLRQVVAGRATTILSAEGSLLAASHSEPGFVLRDGSPVDAGLWRVVLARARKAEEAGGAEAAVEQGGAGGQGRVGGAGAADAGSGSASSPEGASAASASQGAALAEGGASPGQSAGPPAEDGSSNFLLEEAAWLDETGARGASRTSGGVLTAGLAWLDDATIAAAIYCPKGASAAEGVVMAIGPDGSVLWTHDVGHAPVHRLASRSGTGLIAAATPGSLALLDGGGNLLWSKSMRDKIIDLGLQSHGGPAVIAGDRLLSYDRRGNLLWRKNIGPARALACLGDRIAVATVKEIVVYDEDGLERWSLACAAAPTDLAIDPGGAFVAVVLDSGTLILAQAPGQAATGTRAVGSRGGSVL